MVILSTFTIIEVATAVVAIVGSFGVCMAKSRCSKISACGMNCEREVIKKEPEKETELPISRSSSSSDFDNALTVPNNS